MAILTFRNKALQRLFEDDDRRGVPPGAVHKLMDMLAALDAARTLTDLRVFPGWRLHPLSGNLVGLWSLTVTGNRRLVFRFSRGNASDVDLVDYH
jgi:proteic killer suppression protein